MSQKGILNSLNYCLKHYIAILENRNTIYSIPLIQTPTATQIVKA